MLKHERDDLNTLNIVSKQLRKCQNSSIKAYKGMKHAMMRNKECTLKIYTLNEGVYKNVLPPFPITKFLRLASSTICDIWDLAFLWSMVSKCYIDSSFIHTHTYIHTCMYVCMYVYTHTHIYM